MLYSRSERVLRIIGIVSNVILSIIYAIYSLVVSFFGLMLLVYSNPSSFSFVKVIILASGVLFLSTILFSIAGIVLSVILRIKGRFVWSLIIQFLPLATTLLAVFLFILSVFVGN